MIFGEMRRNGGRSFSDQLLAISDEGELTKLFPADARAHWRNEKVTLIQHTLWNTAESRADYHPKAGDDSQLLIAAWARIDNRDELTAKLGIQPASPQLSDSDFILRAYQKWGEDCVEHLIGDFVFAIFDARNQKIFCARDHMGVRPLYYHLSENLFLFASGLAVFHQLKGFELEPSQQWMAEFLVGTSMSLHTTPYPNIVKLPPAHCLTIWTDRSHLRQYFQLSPDKTLHLNDSREYVDTYREVLEESIRCRLRSEHPIGTELSGGLDSSTITAFASRLVPRPEHRLHAFAFTSEQESEYVHAISDVVPLAAIHELACPSDFPEQRMELSGRSVDILGYPAEHEVAYLHEPFYRLAEGSDIRTLLSGYGGDEFVTTFGSLARIELLTRGEYKQLYRNTRGNPVARVLRMLKLSLLWLYTRNNLYSQSFHQLHAQEWSRQLIKEKWARQYNLHERFMDQAKFDAGYRNLNAFILDKMWPPYGPVRMEACTLMAASRKIEYRWPLLDVRLVKLFMSIPASEKFTDGIGRSLHRRAIEGVVPKKVAWRTYKDTNMPSYDGAGTSPSCLRPDDLHPGLRELLNIEKLESQLALLSGKSNIDDSEDLISMNYNIDCIISLNQWLQHARA